MTQVYTHRHPDRNIKENMMQYVVIHVVRKKLEKRRILCVPCVARARNARREKFPRKKPLRLRKPLPPRPESIRKLVRKSGTARSQTPRKPKKIRYRMDPLRFLNPALNPSTSPILLEDAPPKNLQSVADLNQTKASRWRRGRRAARADRARRKGRVAELPLRACSRRPWRG